MSTSKNPIDLMDRSKRTIWLEDGIGQTYAVIFFSTFVIFWAIIFSFKAFFDKVWRSEEYLKFNSSERWYWVSNWAANVHHICICSYIVYTCGWTYCSKTDKPYIYALVDEVCLMEVHKDAVYGIMFTLGYFIYDYIAQVYFSAEANNMLGQIKFHHIIVLTAMTCGLFVGYGFVTIGFIGLSIEFSTIFLNYRSLFSREELSKPLPTAI